jgi:hypothetical protein
LFRTRLFRAWSLGAGLFGFGSTLFARRTRTAAFARAIVTGIARRAGGRFAALRWWLALGSRFRTRFVTALRASFGARLGAT